MSHLKIKTMSKAINMPARPELEPVQKRNGSSANTRGSTVALFVENHEISREVSPDNYQKVGAPACFYRLDILTDCLYIIMSPRKHPKKACTYVLRFFQDTYL
jgi:hypothetical protein